jgi:hypothetical protein
MKVFLASLAIVAAGLMAAAPADALLFNLTSNHCTDQAGCGAPGTIFGTVTLTQDGTAVDFIVHLNDPYAFVKTGALDSQAFEFNAISVALGDISITQNVAGQTLAAHAGPFTQGSVGTFGFGIECDTCANAAPGSFNTNILFTVADSVITDFTDPNLNGNVFAVDILNTTNGATGPIDASGGGVGGSTIPEPATLLLLGSGLLSLGLAGRVRGLLRN